jgi:hypothetical protein
MLLLAMSYTSNRRSFGESPKKIRAQPHLSTAPLGDRPSTGKGEWAAAGWFQNAPGAGWFLSLTSFQVPPSRWASLITSSANAKACRQWRARACPRVQEVQLNRLAAGARTRLDGTLVCSIRKISMPHKFSNHAHNRSGHERPKGDRMRAEFRSSSNCGYWSARLGGRILAHKPTHAATNDCARVAMIYQSPCSARHG